MTNGQLNVVSVVPAVLMAAQPQAAPAVSVDGTQQDEGAFAGLLSGIQAEANVKVAADSGQAEPARMVNDKEQSVREVAAEVPSVDLMALIQGMQHAAPLAEPAVQKTEQSGKVAVITEPVPVGTTPAAFPRSGRMPEVNVPAQPGVDMLQNVATVSEQPSVAAALPDAKTGENVESRRMVAVQPAAKAVADLPTVPVAVASTPAEPAKTAEKQPLKSSDLLAEVPQLQTPETVQSLPAGHLVGGAGEREQSDRRSIVNTLTTASGDNQHNKTAETGMPARFTSAPANTQVVQANAESVQPAVILSETKASVTVADSTVAQFGTSDVEAPAKPSDKTASVSGMIQGQAGSPRQVAPALVSSPAEVEMQLSQPQPIAARAAAVSIATCNRSAALVQEAYGTRQRTNPEQQQEVVKEMASSQRGIAVPEELALGSELSGSEDGNQKQSDVTSDNLMPMQDLRGQAKVEHQKAASVSARPVSTEPVRENISEQVMQQVKDRLVQHDAKPGSQQITLTLSPDSLGEVKMNLNLQGSKLSVEIVTENKVVRDSIAQHADTLKDSLSRQNITMESFDVTTGGKGSGSQGQNQNAWRELAKQQQQQQFWNMGRGYAVAQADLPAGNAAYMKQQGQSMLDIHY